MNILLIQNEPYALFQLEQYVRQYYPSDHITSYSDARTALAYIQTGGMLVDLCFTPVKTDGPSGIQIAKALREQSRCTRIVFTAKTNEYALDAWKLGVNDYLLEPVTPEGVQHALMSCAPCSPKLPLP